MKIDITIECELENELLGHLSSIRAKIKKEIKKQGGEIFAPIHLEETNCAGVQNVVVIPDCNGTHFPDGNGFCLSCNRQLPEYEDKH